MKINTNKNVSNVKCSFMLLSTRDSTCCIRARHLATHTYRPTD